MTKDREDSRDTTREAESEREKQNRDLKSERERDKEKERKRDGLKRKNQPRKLSVSGINPDCL